MKVIFLEARSTNSISPLLKDILKKLVNYKTVGITSTVQHIDQIKVLQEYLVRNGKKVVLAKGSRCVYPGQVLGCDPGAAKGAEAYLFIGSGNFHPIAIAAETQKPVFTADLISKKVSQISEQEVKKYLTQRIQRAHKVMDANKIGILVTTKRGQSQLSAALILRKKLEKKGKKVFIFLGDTIDINSLINFSEVEAWINTCCPRMAEDFPGRPIANFSDLRV